MNREQNVTVLAGCLTIGTFLALPYAHLIKAPEASRLELISIDQTDWHTPPPLPVPESVVEPRVAPLPKPALAQAKRDLVPLKAVLNFDLGMLDVGGDFDLSFSVDPLVGGVGNSVLELGDVDSMPQPLVQLRPHYPAHARMRQIEGNVRVVFIVNANGRTENIRILSSTPESTFDRAAIRAVDRWRFSPGMLDGKPVAVQVSQNIRFELE